MGPALALALWRRLLFREDGRNAEGFSPHRTKTQGGLPPYLRAAQSGDAFRLSEASLGWAAVIILGSHPLWGRAHGMGAGGSPCWSGRISGDSPPDQGCRGYRLRPRVGRRGDCLLAIYLLAICCLFLTIVIYMLYNIFLGGFVMLSFCPIVLLLGYQFSIYP